jgi:uracil phosphoribosyltransferase
VDWIRKYLVPRSFRRIQVNATAANGVDTSNLTAAVPRLLSAIHALPQIEWILQANEESAPLWKRIAEARPPNVSILHDASCGGGKVLTSFASLVPDMRCGYAGGLGPHNLREMIERMRKDPALADKTLWLDMESKVRSTVDGADRFDISKAWSCAAIVNGLAWDNPNSKAKESTAKTYPPNARIRSHPLLAHKITLLRDRTIPPREFRQLLSELTTHIGYEASTSLQLRPREHTVTPYGIEVGADAQQVDEHIAIVPIMRAGLGMVEPMLDLLPNAVVHHIGMYRAQSSKRPIEYYSRLPKESSSHLAIVLDPNLATGQTALAVVAKLKAWGAQRIIVLSILASQLGLAALNKEHPDVEVYAASVDEDVDAEGNVNPGLGDAGDRQFGTPLNAQVTTNGAPAPKIGNTPVLRPMEGPGKSPFCLNPEDDAPITTVLGDPNEVGSEEDEEIPPAHLEDESSSTPLTTHDGGFGASPVRLNWGAERPITRGPVVGTVRHSTQRNAIGAHSGGYSIYKALAVVSGGLDPEYFPKLGMTTPVARIGPFEAWHDPERIVTMDPYGHAISEAFAPWLRKGYDVRPTIAVTKAHIELPECREAIACGRLVADGSVLTADGQSFVTKAAIEPVWYLPGIARRFDVTEDALREALFKETNSMYPEILTRRDLKLFLPPIGGMTVYIWGDPEKIPDESVELTVRVHDECNGSDVFGSDICTCRPYLSHAIEESIKTAQRGGTGVVVYFRKEGRALGEVTKYLVYNMRKRQKGGDSAAEYFNCTRTVAGVTDTRFQKLMPDVLHWLGITRIHRFISMSDMKYNAIVETGIKIDERVEIPPELVPKDAQVEITAKVFHGYHGGKKYKVDDEMMNSVMGREYTKDTEYEKSVKEGGNAVSWKV